MKKLILFLMLCALNVQAQKTVKIYNYTAYSVQFFDFVTRPTATPLPEFHSKPFGGVTIAPYGSYTMVNTTNATRFPFYSPTSVPVITTWERQSLTAPTSSTMANTVAWLQGANQVFSYIRLTINGQTKYLGNPLVSSYPNAITGSGWTATYATLGTATAPIYTITIN
jgi:hypothetical protein